MAARGTRRMSGSPHWGWGMDADPDPRPISRKTVRRVVGSFRPYRGKVSLVGFLIVVTASLGVVNPLLIAVVFDQALFPQERHHAAAPAAAGHAPAVLDLRPDDPHPDHHEPDRRGPDLPGERGRAARDAGLPQLAVRAPPAHAAAVLHQHAHRRDPVAAGQRRRRCAERGHRYRVEHPVERRDHHQHAGRDADPVVAADRAVAGDHAAVRLLHRARGEGAAGASPRSRRSRWPR